MEHHAGEIVELAVRRHNVNISGLSKRLHVNRRTLYNWFGQKKLRADVIVAIGTAINYDFSKDFKGAQPSFTCPHEPDHFKNDADPDPSGTVYYWMEKYIALLEDYKNLSRNSRH